MGYHEPCPYVEKDPRCGKCVTCHAIDPPVMDKTRRRLCTRTRQWPGCGRYQEAWKRGVKPFREDYVVKEVDVKPAPTGGIGGIGRIGGPVNPFPNGLPTAPRAEPEVPCEHLVYKESSCKTCGGYTCTAAGDKRIMDTMLDLCMETPGECAIYIRVSESK